MFWTGDHVPVNAALGVPLPVGPMTCGDMLGKIGCGRPFIVANYGRGLHPAVDDTLVRVANGLQTRDSFQLSFENCLYLTKSADDKMYRGQRPVSCDVR